MSAKTLKRLLADISLDRSVVIMRHGERPIIDDPTRADRVMLTARGLRSARQLGLGLLADCAPRNLFHSTVPRCRQTAEALMAGLRDRQVQPVNHGPHPQLAVPYLPDPQRSYAFALKNDLDPLAFVQAWFAGDLAADLIQDPQRAAREQFEFLRTMRRSHPGFQVHVSHDWNLLLLARVYLGIEPSRENWPGFLEGLLIHFGETTVIFRYRHYQRSLPVGALPVPG